MAVLEPATGFDVGGKVLVFGDHNALTDLYITQQDNTALAQSIAAWVEQPPCGDGFVDSDEDCDDQNADQTDDCLDDCSAASCGDGFVQAGVEDCDDANFVEADTCLNSCVAASCGDGVVQTDVEECDDANADQTDSCLDDCSAGRRRLWLQQQRWRLDPSPLPAAELVWPAAAAKPKPPAGRVAGAPGVKAAAS